LVDYWKSAICYTIELIIVNIVGCAGDVHLFLDIARRNGKCVFFTAHAADSILACMFHSADDVCTVSAYC